MVVNNGCFHGAHTKGFGDAFSVRCTQCFLLNKETKCERVSFTRGPLNWVNSPLQTINVLVFDVRTYKSDEINYFSKPLLYISLSDDINLFCASVKLPSFLGDELIFYGFFCITFYDFSPCEDILEEGLVNDSSKPRRCTNFKIHSGLTVFKLLAVLL